MTELRTFFDREGYSEAHHQILKELCAQYQVIEGPLPADHPAHGFDHQNQQHMIALLNPIQNTKSQNPHNSQRLGPDSKSGTGPGSKKRKFDPDQSSRGRPALQKKDATTIDPLQPNQPVVPPYMPGVATWLPTMLHWASFKF